MTSDGDLRTKVNRGLAWVAMASSVVGVLDFVSFILILKFWIGASELGVWAVVGALFLGIELAAELGLTAAIVQRGGHTRDRLSTIFWLNVLLAGAFYLLVAGLAPLLAWLYERPEIIPLMLVFGLNLLIRATCQVPYALMTRELRFGETSIIRIAGNLADAGCRIGLAAAGAGAWCFVAGVMARNVVMAVGLQLREPWWPKLVLRPRDATDYIKFGLRSSGGKILFQLYTNVDYQIVMYFFGAAATGIYRAAYDLVLEPIKYLSNIITGVGFATFSRLKHDRSATVEQFISFSRQNLVVIGTLLALILLAAEELLLVLTKAEYAAGATAARVLAIVGVFRAMSFIAPPLLDGLGYPQKTLRYQAVATVLIPALFVLGALLLGDSVGYLSVAIAWAVGYPIAFAILAWMTLEVIELAPLEYLRRIIGVPLCVAAAGAVGLGARWLTSSWSPGWRLGAITATVLVSVGVLLARFQDISPRTVAHAIRGPGDAGTGGDAPPEAR